MLALALAIMPAPALCQAFTSSLYGTADASMLSAKAPLCSQPTIPSGNMVGGTTAETQFATACYVSPGVAQTATVLRQDLRFQLGVNAVVPTLRGRVLFARSASPNLGTCVAAQQCVVILDTGNVGGLTAGSALYGNADISYTFQSPTLVEASGQLNFQTGASAVIAISAQSAGSSNAPAVTIPWDTTTLGFYIVQTANWSSNSSQNYIQKRQDTLR